MKHDRTDAPLPQRHGSGSRLGGPLDAGPQVKSGFWVDLPAQNAVGQPGVVPGTQRPESLPELQPQQPVAPRELSGDGRGDFRQSITSRGPFEHGASQPDINAAPAQQKSFNSSKNFPVSQNGKTAFFPGYPLNPGQLNPLYDSAHAAKTDPQGSWTGVPVQPRETPVQDADDL